VINDILLETEKKMETSITILKRELGAIRTGRASPTLVDNIRVDYNGIPTPIMHLANISVPDAHYLVIQPWDKSCIPLIEKSVLTSDLGITPSNDGNIIRLNIPPLSEERRSELIKIVNKRVEQDKVAIRNLRRDAKGELEKLERDKEISQDILKRSLDQLQKLTDAFVDLASDVGLKKVTELSEI
jgi:ribosome recycling factor